MWPLGNYKALVIAPTQSTYERLLHTRLLSINQKGSNRWQQILMAEQTDHQRQDLCALSVGCTSGLPKLRMKVQVMITELLSHETTAVAVVNVVVKLLVLQKKAGSRLERFLFFSA